MTSQVICVHLLNDFSGSTRVLGHVIEALRLRNVEVTLHTSAGGSGFLSRLNVAQKQFAYTRSHRVRIVTLAGYLASQVRVFFELMQYRDQDVIVLVNTLLPFGAGIAGRVMKKRVVYYVHETSVRPRMLKKFLSRVARGTADHSIFVSQYLRNVEGHDAGRRSECIVNALTPEMVEDAESHWNARQPPDAFVVLMACSPRDYKGVPEFLQVARHLVVQAGIRFELVLNGTSNEVESYLRRFEVPENVRVFPATADIRPFYRRASVVVNLSRPTECVETFGLTLIEAMAYGIPVIAPPAGGPVEIVQHADNGFLIDSKNTLEVSEAISRLFGSTELRVEMGRKARERARNYHPARFEEEVVRAILG